MKAKQDDSLSISLLDFQEVVSMEGREHLHLHERLAQSMRDAILSGRFVKGSWLPSIEAIAEGFKMNPLTVGRALATLEEQRLIVRKQGSGTYVSRTTFNAAEMRAAEKLAAAAADVNRREGLDAMQMRTVFNEVTRQYERPKKKKG